jgi:hypothetical protein
MPIFVQRLGGVANKVNNKFHERKKKHDEFEEKVMDIMRPFTTRRHLPDRFVSFNDKLYAFDMKTTPFVEDKSHDEYFRLCREENIPVFIVYVNDGEIMADWITKLTWQGPFPPSEKSTCGDPYYKISGGRTLEEFLECSRNSDDD